MIKVESEMSQTTAFFLPLLTQVPLQKMRYAISGNITPLMRRWLMPGWDQYIQQYYIVIGEVVRGNGDPILCEQEDSEEGERFQRVQPMFTLSPVKLRKLLHVSMLGFSKECLQWKKGCTLSMREEVHPLFALGFQGGISLWEKINLPWYWRKFGYHLLLWTLPSKSFTPHYGDWNSNGKV